MSDESYSHPFPGYYSHQTSNKQHIPMAGDFPGGPPTTNPEPQFLVPALPNKDLHSSSRPGSSNIERSSDQFGHPTFMVHMSENDGSMERKPGTMYPSQTIIYHQANRKPEVPRQQPWNQLSQKIVEQMHAPRNNEENKYPILNKKLQAINPVIPDATMRYICKRHGGEPNDNIACRAVSVAAEKLGVDLIADAISIARSRGMGQVNRNTKETKYTLTKALLREVAQERGINLP